MKCRQGVHGLQAFAFSLATVMMSISVCFYSRNCYDEHTKPRFKTKLGEVEFKERIYHELCIFVIPYSLRNCRGDPIANFGEKSPQVH